MQIPDRDKERFEALDDQRRRLDDEFNFLVQQIRDGSVSDPDRASRQAQFLHAKHEGIIRDMIDMLAYYSGP